MKKKRRFINWGTVMIFTIMLGIIVCKISHTIIIKINSDTFEAYSEDDYRYLLEIAKTAVTEGKGIDTSKIPKDVIYEISGSKSGETIFTYELKRDVNFRLQLPLTPNMTVTLSKDQRILSKDSNYESKEKFTEECKRKMLLWPLMIGFWCWIIPLVYALQRAEITRRKKTEK